MQHHHASQCTHPTIRRVTRAHEVPHTSAGGFTVRAPGQPTAALQLHCTATPPRTTIPQSFRCCWCFVPNTRHSRLSVLRDNSSIFPPPLTFTSFFFIYLTSPATTPFSFFFPSLLSSKLN